MGVVYFIQCDDYVKIGFTYKEVKERLKAMQIGNPHKLKIVHQLLGNQQSEQRLHTLFKEYHHRGEWFKIEGNLEFFIEKKLIIPGTAPKLKDRFHFNNKVVNEEGIVVSNLSDLFDVEV
jgi:hypothetical protein